jgi:hypothetical protein
VEEFPDAGGRDVETRVAVGEGDAAGHTN